MFVKQLIVSLSSRNYFMFDLGINLEFYIIFKIFICKIKYLIILFWLKTLINISTIESGSDYIYIFIKKLSNFK